MAFRKLNGYDEPIPANIYQIYKLVKQWSTSDNNRTPNTNRTRTTDREKEIQFLIVAKMTQWHISISAYRRRGMKWMKPQNCRQTKNKLYFFIVTSIGSHQSSVNAYGETKERLPNPKWSRINLSDKKRYDDDGWRRIKAKQQANALKLMREWLNAIRRVDPYSFSFRM